jgi:hypothetical protein
MRFNISLAGLLLASWLVAAEPKVSRDLPYAKPKNKLQTLDMYAPAEGTNHPVIVWIPTLARRTTSRPWPCSSSWTAC